MSIPRLKSKYFALSYKEKTKIEESLNFVSERWHKLGAFNTVLLYLQGAKGGTYTNHYWTKKSRLICYPVKTAKGVDFGFKPVSVY